MNKRHNNTLLLITVIKYPNHTIASKQHLHERKRVKNRQAEWRMNIIAIESRMIMASKSSPTISQK
jgi:hypothetical protein